MVGHSELRQAWRQLLADAPRTRARDAAEKLGVSEGELVASTVGETATRLAAPFPRLIHHLPSLGRVMALTRNAHAVSEVRGLYGGIEIDGQMGQVVGEEIDLRLFLHGWAHGFAVVEPDGELAKRSLQFFDGSGTAVHKIFLEAGSDIAAFDRLVAAHTAPSQAPGLTTSSARPRSPEAPDAEIDRAALLEGWDQMRDTHEFYPLLHRLGLTRRQAFRLGGPSRARRVEPFALATVLRHAADAIAEIMIFVGNTGVLQVRSGVVNRLLRTGPWFNVLDPGFNLHVREDHLHEGWVVKKPTSAGVVTSLELLDLAGETVALLFDKRRDRERPERELWRTWLEALP
jgi:putative hemin transport protein